MRLCFLATGESVHSHRWIRFFSEKGHDIYWISLAPRDGHAPVCAKFYDVSSELGKYASLGAAALKIRRIIREIHPEIVHAHYAGSYGLLGAISGFQPLVLTAWGSDILFAGRSRLKGPLVRWALTKATLITCDAHHMIGSMQALGADVKKIHLVFFGVEVDRFCPGPGDVSIRAGWGAKGSPVVISLRNLEPVYSIETLIQAVPSVIPEVPEVRFVIAGNGSQELALKELTRLLGLEASVSFIGRYSNYDLPNILRSADVYVSTSLSDAGLASSTAEAMACGLPVVITDTGENRRWVDDEKSGFVVAAKDPQALAEKIIVLLKDSAKRASMGQAAREVIVQRNNYEREMERMEGMYRDLLVGRRGKSAFECASAVLDR